MLVGLRIDVDTFRGTKLGVPVLLRLLDKYGIQASFFCTVGPDNMGRHLYRLIRPKFLLKMLCSNAAGLYGWDIIFKGTLWPGPVIGKTLSGTIRAVAGCGHELGFHAWDHHQWQVGIDRLGPEGVREWMRRGVELLTTAAGVAPTCSAAPGWRCNDTALLVKEEFSFEYNSDCRGTEIFQPVVKGVPLKAPQIPVTLPTYDEAIGRNGITAVNYNEYLLSLITPDKLNVLTIHAEAEGGCCAELFDDFLKRGQERGIKFVPLGRMLLKGPAYPQAQIVPREIAGREGWVACQEALLVSA